MIHRHIVLKVLLVAFVLALATGCGSTHGTSTAIRIPTNPTSPPAEPGPPAATFVPELAQAIVANGTAVPVPSQFLGLAHEWAAPQIGIGAQLLMGDQASGVNTIYRQLLANLTSYGSGPLVIRIGGDSTDTFSTAQSIEAFKELNAYNGALFYLGVNLKTATLSEAKAMASTYYQSMPPGSLLGLEIGNEPDLYGVPEAQFIANFTSWAAGIRSVTSSKLPILGPSCSAWACNNGVWTDDVMSTAIAGNVATFSQHQYIEGQSPVPDALLQSSAYPNASTAEALIAQTHQAGLPFRLGEWNSDWAAYTTVSSQFQSALWAIKSLYLYASWGADGVNIFGNLDGNNGYNMIQFDVAQGSPNVYTLDQVFPLYYGALAFQMGTGHQAQVYPVNVTAGTSSAVSAFDTIDSTGTERMTLINFDETNHGEVTIDPQGTYRTAQVCYLSAPSYQSSTGVTLCGQTFDGSTDGTIHGSPEYTTLEPNSGGGFSIPLQTTEAAIVTFTK